MSITNTEILNKLREFNYSVSLVDDTYHVSKDGFNWMGESLVSARLYEALRLEYARQVLGHTHRGKGSGLPVCVAHVSSNGRFAYSKLYKTATWRALRKQQLLKQPLCAYCLALGNYTPAEVVDHKIAHRGSDALFKDENNLQSLCKICHDNQAQIKDILGHAPVLYDDLGYPLPGYQHHWSDKKPQG